MGGLLNNTMKKSTVIILILACVWGIIASVFLTIDHVSLREGTRVHESICNVSDKINCDVVHLSDYSELMNTPTSSIGVFVYLLLFLIIIIGNAYNKRFIILTKSIVHIAALLMMAYSLFLFYVSYAILETFCIFCASLYVTNIIILIASWWTSPIQSVRVIMEALFNLVKRPYVHQYGSRIGVMSVFALIAIFIVLPFVTRGTVTGLIASNASEFSQDNMVSYYQALPTIQPIDVTASPRIGPKDAPVTIIEFGDFQCPFCKRTSFILETLTAAYKNKVALYYKHFPLDSRCNPYIESPMHPYACMLAQASYCSSKQNQFWAYSHFFNKPIPHVQLTDLEGWANDLGLNTEQFMTCLKDKNAFLDYIRNDIHVAKRIIDDIGLETATPIVIINNRVIQGALSIQFYKAFIDYELNGGKLK